MKPNFQLIDDDGEDKDLKCPVCDNYFAPPNLPKIMPICQHTLCEVCIPKVIKNSRVEVGYDVYRNDNKLTCPECRKKCDPQENYKTNLRLQSLAERAKKKKEQQASNGTTTTNHGKIKNNLQMRTLQYNWLLASFQTAVPPC